jgi:O-methyltransferase involved in polyketide biosynthesis
LAKNKDFLALQAEWDQKLADSGFEDAENRDGTLKVWASHFFAVRYNPTLFQAKEDYYRAAGSFLHEFKFANKGERAIWELHSQGISIREIVKILKKRGTKTHRRKVHETLQRLAKEMGARVRPE